MDWIKTNDRRPPYGQDIYVMYEGEIIRALYLINREKDDANFYIKSGPFVKTIFPDKWATIETKY